MNTFLHGASEIRSKIIKTVLSTRWQRTECVILTIVDAAQGVRVRALDLFRNSNDHKSDWNTLFDGIFRCHDLNVCHARTSVSPK